MAASQTAPSKLRLFLSYSRRNMGVADAVVEALEKAGFEVKIDRRSLSFGEVWQTELEDFIRVADTIVWLVSPASIGSQWCQWELNTAEKYAKRIVPVRIEPVAPEDLPGGLAKFHILPAEGVFSLDEHAAALIEALHKDRVWLQDSTRLAERAHVWNEKGRPSAHLIGGVALKDAEGWAARRPPSAPPPSAAILDFLLASRKRAGSLQRWAIGGALGVAAVAGALAFLAFVQRQSAVEQRDAALINQSRLLADAANQEITAGDAATGLLLALAALPNAEEGVGRPDAPEAENMLLSALLKLKERAIFDAGSTATYSPDGSKIAYTTPDNAIRVISSADDHEIALFPNKTDVTKLAFSRDGARIAVATNDEIKIFDVASKRELLSLANKGGFNSIRFSPTGDRLLVTSGFSAPNKGALVWDLAGQRSVLAIPHSSDLNYASFSADGRRIVTASKDHLARIFDATTGALIRTLTGHTNEVYYASFSPDGSMVATASVDETVRVWNTADGSLLQTLAGNKIAAWSAEFSHDGTRVVSASRDQIVRIWDVKSGAEVSVLKGQVKPLTRGIAYGDLSAEFSPDDKMLLSAHNDDTVRLWTLEPYPAETFATDCKITKPLVSADASIVVGLCGTDTSNVIHVWSGATGKALARIDGPAAGVDIAYISADGAMLALLSKDGNSYIYAIPNGGLVSTLPQGSEITSGVLSKSGTRLVTGSKDGNIKIWERSPGSMLWSESAAKVATSDPEIYCLAFTPEADKLVSLSFKGTGHIWDPLTGKEIAPLTEPNRHDQSGWPAACALSADGRYAATGLNARTLLWDGNTGALLAAVRTTNDTPLLAMAFSADSKRLISAGIEWQTWIGEVPTGRTIRYVDTTAYDPFSYDAAGEVLVTVDPGVQLNDAVTGRELAVIEGDYDKGGLSSDGMHPYATTKDGKIHLWSLPHHGSERVALARKVAPRCLTSLQLENAGLEAAPPRWCITGPDHVADKDPSSWDGKWPYRTAEWRNWLAARDRGESPTLPAATGGGPPPPSEESDAPAAGAAASDAAGASPPDDAPQAH